VILDVVNLPNFAQEGAVVSPCKAIIVLAEYLTVVLFYNGCVITHVV